MEIGMNDIIKNLFHEAVKEQLNEFLEKITERDSLPEIFTLPEAAQFLRVSQDWLRKNLASYNIPYFKTGCDYKFRKKQLLEWADNNMQLISKKQSKRCS